MSSTDDTGQEHVSSVGRTWINRGARASTGDPGLLRQRRKSRRTYATTPAKQAERIANPLAAVFDWVMVIMLFVPPFVSA
jgi:hypothetical protein